MITNLQSDIIPYLQGAKKFYLATALINKGGYEVLTDHLPQSCECQYMIGINLPSCPDVLQEMWDKSHAGKLSVRIYNTGKTYHPKVYIIETIDDQIVAFVGSANTTAGGLRNNVEMSAKIDSVDICNQLIEWFRNLFAQSSELNQGFIDQYRQTIQHVKIRDATNRSDITRLTSLLSKPVYASGPISPVLSADQFFSQEYFDAYQSSNWYDYSEAANARRKNVRSRLLELHEMIYPRFADYRMNQLHCHYQSQNITSGYSYKQGFTRKDLKSMWLHYGYSKDQIPSGSSFLNHPRIQLILEPSSLGIWLVVGKNGAAIEERKQFQKQLETNQAFQELTYEQITNLGASYWVSIEDDEKYVDQFVSADEWNEFVQEDNYSGYFIIGRTFEPSDDLFSVSNVVDTVLNEFQRLYPLFRAFSV